MTQLIESSQIPFEYPLCSNNTCSNANTCLHQLAEQSFSDTYQTCVYLNPKMLAKIDGACSYYKSNTKVKYAKGMMNMLNDMPHKQMKGFVRSLKENFSSRTYYRMRKGERLLSPSEQEQVIQLAESNGANIVQVFDEYVLKYQW